MTEQLERAAARIAENAPYLTEEARLALITALVQLAFAEGAAHTVNMMHAVPAAAAAIHKARTQ